MTLMWGCRHANYSWPQGRGRIKAVACLDCGKPLAYDWKLMRIVKVDQPQTIEQHDIAQKELEPAESGGRFR